MGPQVKWRLEAHEPGAPRHRKLGEHGPYESTALFSREYERKSSALRAARQVHRRFPDAVVDIMPYHFRGSHWGGDTKDREALYWCARCGGGPLQSEPPWWVCPRCGDEWADEVVRGEEG